MVENALIRNDRFFIKIPHFVMHLQIRSGLFTHFDVGLTKGAKADVPHFSGQNE